MDRIATARAFRQGGVLAEERLWAMVRARKIDGFKFRRQVPIDRFFADFLCLEAKLIVEVDGPSHNHQADYDQRRTEVLESLGYRLIRFTNLDVLGDPSGVRIRLRKALATARPGSVSAEGLPDRP
jgi:very-short-patch-repair endonuclease